MEMKLKILVADDDKSLRGLICDILNKQGHETIAACDGNQAINQFEKNTDVSLVILDVMMPGLSGFEVLDLIRRTSDVPVLMLTAFVARVESLLRNMKKEKMSNVKIGKLELQRRSHKVLISDEEIQLNNKEYKLLDFLVSNRGIVLSRSKILDVIWGYNYAGDDKTINTHIKTLRSKLGPCAIYIKTIKGTGYMFDGFKRVEN
jgi:DNA-binding response OmpR family regulator